MAPPHRSTSSPGAAPLVVARLGVWAVGGNGQDLVSKGLRELELAGPELLGAKGAPGALPGGNVVAARMKAGIANV